MSCGERSCKKFGSCGRSPYPNACNVACDQYESNGRDPDEPRGNLVLPPVERPWRLARMRRREKQP